MIWSTLWLLACVAFVTVVACLHFGALAGLALGAALYVLMPYGPTRG